MKGGDARLLGVALSLAPAMLFLYGCATDFGFGLDGHLAHGLNTDLGFTAPPTPDQALFYIGTIDVQCQDLFEHRDMLDPGGQLALSQHLTYIKEDEGWIKYYRQEFYNPQHPISQKECTEKMQEYLHKIEGEMWSAHSLFPADYKGPKSYVS